MVLQLYLIAERFRSIQDYAINILQVSIQHICVQVIGVHCWYTNRPDRLNLA